MTDEQIAKLKAIVESGESVYWLDVRDRTPRKIRSIGQDVVREGGIEEPSEVAYFENESWRTGIYIALWNCEAEEFVVMKPVFGAEKKS